MCPLRWHTGFFLVALCLVAGCAPRSLYQADAGPHAVRVTHPVIHDPQQERDIALRVVAPAEAGHYPVVVFSHGAFCYTALYAAVTDHWASHGYVVIAPDHLDSSDNPRPLRPDQLAALLDSRIRDLTFVVDDLDEIRRLSGIAGMFDRTRLAVAGHSFGGMLAQIKAGLMLRDPASGAAVSRADPRFRAAVVMSGVGPMKQTADAGFSGLTGPLMATGGTSDAGNIGDGRTYPWEWRMSAFSLAPPTHDKYAVVVDKADHYLGGLICREDRTGPKDPEAVAIDRALTTAFLDAYVREDRSARRFLAHVDLGRVTGGRATLQRR